MTYYVHTRVCGREARALGSAGPGQGVGAAAPVPLLALSLNA